MKDKAKWPCLVLGLWMLSALPAFSQQRPAPPETADTDKRLQADAGQCDALKLHGSGAVWRRVTGLSPRRGLIVRDRHLINQFLNAFRCTDTPTNWSPSEESDLIGMEFLDKHGGSGNTDGVIYLRHGTRPMAFIVKGDSLLGVFLRPGSDQRFEDFLNRVAKKAHAHSPGVSYTAWGSH